MPKRSKRGYFGHFFDLFQRHKNGHFFGSFWPHSDAGLFRPISDGQLDHFCGPLFDRFAYLCRLKPPETGQKGVKWAFITLFEPFAQQV